MYSEHLAALRVAYNKLTASEQEQVLPMMVDMLKIPVQDGIPFPTREQLAAASGVVNHKAVSKILTEWGKKLLAAAQHGEESVFLEWPKAPHTPNLNERKLIAQYIADRNLYVSRTDTYLYVSWKTE